MTQETRSRLLTDKANLGVSRVSIEDASDAAEGERFYGYFPMADVLRARPERLSERGFYDGSEHRQGLPSPYNQYTRCRTDGAYVAELSDFQMLLRPLFFTSYMLADFLADNDFFGARRLVFSSASSKTAYGTAFALADSAGEDGIERIGLTSGHHREYVTGLGLYQKVLDYQELETLDTDLPTLYVDFSGSDALRDRIHHHFGSSLAYDCYAGSATNTEFLDAQRWPEPVPEFFFAPVQIRKRNHDWGPQALSDRFGAAQRRFLAAVSDPRKGWMELRVHQGLEAAGAVIDDLYRNGGEPNEGHVVRLR